MTSEPIGTVVEGPYSSLKDAYKACGVEQTILEEARGASYWIAEFGSKPEDEDV